MDFKALDIEKAIAEARVFFDAAREKRKREGATEPAHAMFGALPLFVNDDATATLDGKGDRSTGYIGRLKDAISIDDIAAILKEVYAKAGNLVNIADPMPVVATFMDGFKRELIRQSPRLAHILGPETSGLISPAEVETFRRNPTRMSTDAYMPEPSHTR